MVVWLVLMFPILHKELTDLNIKRYNRKNICSICVLLVISMLMICMMPREDIVSEKEYKSVNPRSEKVTVLQGADFNTEICTTDMLGNRNVAYINKNSKRTYNEVATRNSVTILRVQNYLHDISDMCRCLYWDIIQDMHTDIFILDFIHRQDGEK